ncbi:SRPBCC family protein [Actinoplanes bogorensis]|uniref:SRPBCC family protein n=1 Tax=Paractinoplanes bogorensis TaxID=1610840 RepID=A0ABS5YTX8_9ACTN|nr:SRPBCC family protein [Actinoplanes bogorensis]MBU2666914.1 SRPBCC family protein [Actinoplanes bogorensis]
MRRTLEATGPRPAADVWDRYVRPARWPEWSPQIRGVDYALPTLHEQTRGTVRGPLGFAVPFLVTRVSPPRSWSWLVSAAGVSLILLHRVEATAAGTRTTLTIDGPAPAVLLYRPAAQLALRRLVSG